jgi:hexosaminidase
MNPLSKNYRVKYLWTAICFLVTALPGRAAEPGLMPWPSHMVEQPGYLALDHAPQIHLAGGDERVRQALTRFVRTLSMQTGVPFNLHFWGVPDGPTLTIHCGNAGSRVQNIDEDESYHLTVSESGIQLNAANPLGIMHGLQTLLQLVFAGEHGWVIPYIQIDDTPRFVWRGLMIDVSRHFMPLEAIERSIDAMAAVKLNVLHLHLSDDEGFRVESKRCPRLTSAASGGLFYTQVQVRSLILYARDRGIRVVPEFDVPGHAVSWLVAYPDLASGTPPKHLVQSEHDDLRPPLDPTRESTYKLLDKVFGEMAGIFPDQYFHIGGDEVDGKYWENDAKIQAWMRSHNIKDAHALQTYFSGRVQKIVRKHGKTMEGWDEILDGDLPKDSLIQSWRGASSLASAAKMGYKTILSAGYYLDLMYPASQHYAVDPLGGDSASLTADQKRNILGGEAAQWTEYVTPENLDTRLWPRLGAIAERLWSPGAVTDVDSMYRRLGALTRNLQALHVDPEAVSKRMLRRIEGDDLPPELLETMAMAAEPVKEYDRETTQVYDVTAPLNHLVDAVPPESEAARQINALAVRAVQDPSVRPVLRSWFLRWRDNDARIQPYLAASALRQPLVPLSHSLSELGALGLTALDNLEASKPVSAESRKEQLAQVQATAAHHAEMLLVVTPAVRVLIEAAPGPQ